MKRRGFVILGVVFFAVGGGLGWVVATGELPDVLQGSGTSKMAGKTTKTTPAVKSNKAHSMDLATYGQFGPNDTTETVKRVAGPPLVRQDRKMDGQYLDCWDWQHAGEKKGKTLTICFAPETDRLARKPDEAPA